MWQGFRYPAMPFNKALPQNAFPMAQVFIMWAELGRLDAVWPRNREKDVPYKLDQNSQGYSHPLLMVSVHETLKSSRTRRSSLAFFNASKRLEFGVLAHVVTVQFGSKLTEI